MVIPPLRMHVFASPRPGPRLLVLGGVHGDETCGTRGIVQAIAALDSGALAVCRGQLTLVAVANPLARARGRREGERNLNRSFRPSAAPADYEAGITNRLCPVLDAHDVLLDLHSFESAGQAFAMIGPRDNDGLLEPFRRADEEGHLARQLGTPCVVEGWLDIYAAGIAQRGQPVTDEALSYGWGTNEYMRSRGGYAVTLECGQHADPAAPAIAYAAIEAALQTLGMVDAKEPLAVPSPPRVLQLVAVTDRLAAGDRFARSWTNFDPVASGQAIGVREDGRVLTAPCDGFIVFPNAQATVGAEWYYLAIASDRALRGGMPPTAARA